MRLSGRVGHGAVTSVRVARSMTQNLFGRTWRWWAATVVVTSLLACDGELSVPAVVTVDAVAPDEGATTGAPAAPGEVVFTDAGADVVSPADAGVPVPAAGTEAPSPVDAGAPVPDAGAAAPPPTSSVPGAELVYSGDRTQSPIDAALAQHLQGIAARGNGRATVVSKVGDSISTNASGVSGGYFLNCFDGVLEGTVSWDFNVHLGPFSALAPTLDFFKSTRLGADDSWTRPSLATRVGVTANWAMSGTPSPLAQELAAAAPRYAVVMYGSNDIAYYGGGSYPLADQAAAYEASLRAITDALLAQGVIPLLTTMPPRTDGDWMRYVPVYSGVVRAIAQGRQVPLIDLNRELMSIGPPYGMSGDQVHPSCADYNKCCWFDPASLQHGYNVRNLITLQALDRMHQIFELGATSLDPAAPRLAGDGSKAAPFAISALPYGELRDMRRSPSRSEEPLSCAGAPAVAGPQNLYRLVLTRPTALRALVVGGTHRVSLLSGPSLSTCVKSDPRLVAATLPAGTWYLAVDALTAGGGAEYNLSVTECASGDPGC